MSNSDDVQKLYVAYFGRDFTGIEERIIQTLVGSNPDVIIVDSIPDFLLEPEPCQADYSQDWKEKLPKPTKQKLYIKEPRRQSFRQSMRSVNRNR